MMIPRPTKSGASTPKPKRGGSPNTEAMRSASIMKWIDKYQAAGLSFDEASDRVARNLLGSGLYGPNLEKARARVQAAFGSKVQTGKSAYDSAREKATKPPASEAPKPEAQPRQGGGFVPVRQDAGAQATIDRDQAAQRHLALRQKWDRQPVQGPPSPTPIMPGIDIDSLPRGPVGPPSPEFSYQVEPNARSFDPAPVESLLNFPSTDQVAAGLRWAGGMPLGILPSIGAEALTGYMTRDEADQDFMTHFAGAFTPEERAAKVMPRKGPKRPR